MAHVFRTSACLRFHGDELDPEEISRSLGAQPTQGRKKGGTWTTPKGIENVARTGSWHLSGPDECTGNLDEQIAQLLAPLSKDLEAWKELSSRFNGNLFVGIFLSEFNEGLSLSPQTSRAIGLRGLILDLDLYSADDLKGETI